MDYETNWRKPRDIRNIFLPTTRMNIVRPNVPIIVAIGHPIKDFLIEFKNRVVFVRAAGEERYIDGIQCLQETAGISKLAVPAIFNDPTKPDIVCAW